MILAVLEKEISDVIHCKIQNIFLTTPSPSGLFTSYVWRSFQISLRKQRLCTDCIKQTTVPRKSWINKRKVKQ